MLTHIDERVLAAINLHAVLGALPRLIELSPDAARLLARETSRPTTLSLSAPGGLRAHYRFERSGITSLTEREGRGPTLMFRSAAHLNAVIAGTAQPIPVAGPAGIRFLTRVFTPLTEMLARMLRPSEDDFADPVFAERSTLLTLDVAAHAIAVVANEDLSGKFSAAHMPDGDLDFEVGDDIRYRFEVQGHRVRVDPDHSDAPRAALRFADLDVAGGILSGRESALACVCDGRLQMRGFIPLIDNTSRILDRVGTYLGA
ncbi:hypothetical protein [Microbacterium sp.]|jgi:hypothetical protein|uniref:hypothetical protein n=1 Tax=unclassified Microbacterium TaxID=2609290 RepID=UPI0026092425|nr:hypothetical protein [Microbacterium sp.]